MIDPLEISSMALLYSSKRLELISENVSNLNTNGYKRLMSQTQGITSSEKIDQKKDFSQGSLESTNNPNDLAILGGGFFELLTEGGDKVYSRVGNLTVNDNGMLANAQGFVYSSMVYVPNGATNLEVTETGIVSATLNQDKIVIGNIELVRIVNQSALIEKEAGVYKYNKQAEYLTPGESGAGVLVQGAVEKSNVDLVTEMSDMIKVQREFQINSRLISTSSEYMERLSEMLG